MELGTAASYLLSKSSTADPLRALPHPWLAELQEKGYEVMLLQDAWGVDGYAALLRYALSKIAGPKGQLMELSAAGLPPAKASSGPLKGVRVRDQASSCVFRLRSCSFAARSESDREAPPPAPAEHHAMLARRRSAFSIVITSHEQPRQ